MSARPAQPPAQRSPFRGNVVLRYLERSPIRVRGPVSGRDYAFSAAEPDQPVDARDADALVATRFFRRIGP